VGQREEGRPGHPLPPPRRHIIHDLQTVSRYIPSGVLRPRRSHRGSEAAVGTGVPSRRHAAATDCVRSRKDPCTAPRGFRGRNEGKASEETRGCWGGGRPIRLSADPPPQHYVYGAKRFPFKTVNLGVGMYPVQRPNICTAADERACERCGRAAVSADSRSNQVKQLRGVEVEVEVEGGVFLGDHRRRRFSLHHPMKKPGRPDWDC